MLISLVSVLLLSIPSYAQVRELARQFETTEADLSSIRRLVESNRYYSCMEMSDTGVTKDRFPRFRFSAADDQLVTNDGVSGQIYFRIMSAGNRAWLESIGAPRISIKPRSDGRLITATDVGAEVRAVAICEETQKNELETQAFTLARKNDRIGLLRFFRKHRVGACELEVKDHTALRTPVTPERDLGNRRVERHLISTQKLESVLKINGVPVWSENEVYAAVEWLEEVQKQTPPEADIPINSTILHQYRYTRDEDLMSLSDIEVAQQLVDKVLNGQCFDLGGVGLSANPFEEVFASAVLADRGPSLTGQRWRCAEAESSVFSWGLQFKEVGNQWSENVGSFPEKNWVQGKTDRSELRWIEGKIPMIRTEFESGPKFFVCKKTMPGSDSLYQTYRNASRFDLLSRARKNGIGKCFLRPVSFSVTSNLYHSEAEHREEEKKEILHELVNAEGERILLSEVELIKEAKVDYSYRLFQSFERESAVTFKTLVVDPWSSTETVTTKPRSASVTGFEFDLSELLLNWIARGACE